MILRDYQTEVLQKIQDAAKNGKRRILVCLPTGSGKSLIALSIAIHAMQNGRRSLIWCPRREIAWQMGKILRAEGIDYGIILGDEPHNPIPNIQLATIQSLYSKGVRRKTINMPKADAVIQDESHHSMAETHQKVIALYPDAFHIGLTATPINRNGAGLGTYFEDLICGPSISELTEQGYLAPVKYYVPSIPDLKNMKTVAGDYVEKELSERVDKPKLIGDILENWTRICPKAKTIVSACGVAHSQHIADSFNAIGIKAAHIDGRTPERERDKIVSQYQNNEIQVLTNADVFSEGVDFPDIECLIFARPTKSLGRFLQIVGRGLRPKGGNPLILLDHGAAVYTHGMLDQNFDWKLDYGKKKTINKTRQKQKDKELKKWITCAKCSLVFTGKIICPECSEMVKLKGRPVESFEGYLIELTSDEKAKYSTSDKAVWWSAFVFEAKKKPDYKRSRDGHPARAYALYMEKFKCFPRGFNKNIPAQEGPLDVLAWIRHSKIKYAMRNQNWKKKESVIEENVFA